MLIVLLLSCKKDSQPNTQEIVNQSSEPVWLKVYGPWFGEQPRLRWARTYDVSGWEIGKDLVALENHNYPWQGETLINFNSDYDADSGFVLINGQRAGIISALHSIEPESISDPSYLLFASCSVDKIPKLKDFENLQLIETCVGTYELKTGNWKQLKKTPKQTMIYLYIGDGGITKPATMIDETKYKKLFRIKNVTGVTLYEFESENLDNIIGYLKNYKELRILVIALGGRFVTEKGLEYIGKFPELRELDVNIEAENEDLKNLGSLGKLRKLTLRGLVLDDNGLKHISEIPNLRELNLISLNSSEITNQGWAYLAEMPSLHTLDISLFSELKEGDIEGIAQLKNLRRLRLPASESDSLYLTEALPNCVIDTYYVP